MFRSINRFAAAAVASQSILKDRFLNKGTAFTAEERKALNLHGCLPPRVETLDQQVSRYWAQFKSFQAPINRYQFLRNILATNTTLFYALVERYPEAMLPIIYTPTVGEACQKYSSLFTSDTAAYLSTEQKGNYKQLLRNAHSGEVDIIVITDGSRILGLGDLGMNGVGISVGKCSLYVAGSGIDPRKTLPVIFDNGTNTQKYLEDKEYLGEQHPRVPDNEFYACMDEFMAAATELWPNAVIQFEDFSNNHCFDMLDRYRDKYRCFNDDIQGTGAVVSAGFANALRLSGIPVSDHKVVVFGAGSAAVGVVSSICRLVAAEFNTTAEAVRNCFYLVDTKGLVAKNRGDKLASHKVQFARGDISDSQIKELNSLEAVVDYVKPTALIGLGGVGPVFTEKMIKSVYNNSKKPIIFPLSNPTSKAEVNPTQAYEWTNGDAIIASGSPFPAVTVNGKHCKPSQGNNMYVFPGIGLGAVLARPKQISERVLVAAAKKLSSLLTDEEMQRTGALYPGIEKIREVSKHVAVAVIQESQKEGSATIKLPTDDASLEKLVDKAMYKAEYPCVDKYMH